MPTNKGADGSMMQDIVKTQNFEVYGKIYDQMYGRVACSFTAIVVVGNLHHSNLESKRLKCQLCPGTSSRISRPWCPVAPIFRTKDERIQTRSDKYFNKALKTLSSVNDTELSAYLAELCQWLRLRRRPCKG